MSRTADPLGACIRAILASGVAIALAGCVSTPFSSRAPVVGRTSPEKSAVIRPLSLQPSLEARILGIDPEHVTDAQVHNTLAHGPTPRIILLHGSVYPASLLMGSFATFLDRMGYPDIALKDPRDGSYSQSPYGTSDRIAGEIAWHYEHDGVRPLLIGHSQGGMQAIKVLYRLAGDFSRDVRVWNPATKEEEQRSSIIDPLTGDERPVVGLSVAYASALGSGGAAFVLPNQWEMFDRLRTIPNTVDEFTGFAINGDFVAFSFPGVSDSSRYRHADSAKVRNVVLPATYNHAMVPVTHQLASDPKIREWINAYVPGEGRERELPSSITSYNVLWAADVWYSIKKHWALEAQRLIRARRAAFDNGVRTSAVQQGGTARQ